MSVYYVREFGRVSGHGVNVRDQCGMCDDVTVRRGWSSGGE